MIDGCVYDSRTQLLLLGYENGVFGLYRIEELEAHKLQIFNVQMDAINTLSINHSGDWIALACGENGHLMIWEWKTQQFILNQKTENSSITCVDFSKDGRVS